MEDRRLGFSRQHLLQQGNRLLHCGQPFLTRERRAVLEHLGRDDRFGIGQVGTRLAYAGAFIGLIGVVAAFACFAGRPWDQAVGGSIALIAVIFIAAGAQVARSEFRAQRR